MQIDKAVWAASVVDDHGIGVKELQGRGGAEGLAAGFLPGVAPAFRGSVRAIPYGAPDYPDRMGKLDRVPPVLFVRGGALGSARRVAIVGSRRCTDVGRALAFDLARGLASAGVTVVSGLALGIDAAAHRGALAGGGATLGVLASAVDRPSPARNRDLAEAMVERGGWLVSERPPRAPVFPASFPRRNRLVAALSDVVVVVEAALPSGTLSTVDVALRLDVQVAAVPGSPLAPASRGANALLQAGAWPVCGPNDVLALLDRGADGDPRGRGVRPTDPRADRLPAGIGSAQQWLDALGGPPAQARRALDSLVATGALLPAGPGRFRRVW